MEVENEKMAAILKASCAEMKACLGKSEANPEVEVMVKHLEVPVEDGAVEP
jgi:hypothetical protein